MLNKKTLEAIAAEMDRKYREASEYEARAEIEANLGNTGRARLAADCADHAYAYLEGITWVLQAAGYDYDLDEETNNTKIFKEA